MKTDTEKKLFFRFFLYTLAISLLILSGCIAPSKKDIPDEEDIGISDSLDTESYISEEDSRLRNGDLIFKYAFKEQKKKMYAKNSDYIYLYWLNNKKLYLKGKTKCNIFAINTLYRAGFLCPEQNARTADLMNERLFSDIFPVVNVSRPSQLKKGDLIVWNGHVIIYDTIAVVNKATYAKAIWAGTRKKDNGKNIMNNVIYGKYPLSGDFIVRRPIKRQ